MGTIAYGRNCLWHDDISKAETSTVIPSCPKCGAALVHAIDEDRWNRSVEECDREEYPGYADLVKWMRGKCFIKMSEAVEQYNKETGKTLVIN